jgi:hypothetical protein
MRRIKNMYILLIIGITYTNMIRAQMDIPTPSTYDFVRSGNIPLNGYTGTYNLNIPLYNYQDKNLKFNIGLSYSSAGFKPSKRESQVGLNWHLNVGGVITRKIKGIPDDQVDKKTSVGLTFKRSGFYLLAKKKAFTHKQLEKENIVTSYYKYPIINYSSKKYETEPDMFYFNVNGLSGSFYINIDGEIVVKSNRKIKVELESFSEQSYGGENELNDSEIKLIDERGYIYIFGGNKNYLEYEGNLFKTHNTFALFTNVKIISWYLKEIIANNNRKITFKYKELGKDYPLIEGIDSYHYILNKVNVYKRTENKGMPSEFYPNDDCYYSVSKKCYLEEIKSDFCDIKFNYSRKEEYFYDDFDVDLKYNQRDLKLDSIEITTSEFSLSKKLFYEYLGEGSKRMFLVKVDQGNATYNFDYYKNYSFPKPFTSNIDHWGFWNGGNEDDNRKLIPIVDVNPTNGEVTYSGNNRKPNQLFCNAGMLKSVEYPTKGKTTFEYEPHEYSLRLQPMKSSNFLPSLNSINGFCGGSRIKKIINELGEKEFIYKNGLSQNSKSSGELLYWPSYYMKWVTKEHSSSGWSGVLYYDIYVAPYTYVHYNSTNLNIYNYDDNYITYSNVYTKKNGRIDKLESYITYSDEPDTFNYCFSADDLSTTSYLNTSVRPNSISYRRSKISDVILYEDEKIKKITKFKYKDVLSSIYKHSSNFALNRVAILPHKTYNSISKLDSVITIQYLTDLESITEVESYKYNKNLQIEKKIKKNSKGNTIVDVYKYIGSE